METETEDPNQPMQPATHWCVRRVLENGDEIRYMMTNASRTTTRVQKPAPPKLYAIRVVGREVWKAEALLTEGGDSIGYDQRRRRVSLGLAMGTVKDDDSVIERISQENDS
jgi:hypothetical protein